MRQPKKKKRRFHPVDLESLADDNELPDWVAGAYKWRGIR